MTKEQVNEVAGALQHTMVQTQWNLSLGSIFSKQYDGDANPYVLSACLCFQLRIVTIHLLLMTRPIQLARRSLMYDMMGNDVPALLVLYQWR